MIESFCIGEGGYKSLEVLRSALRREVNTYSREITIGGILKLLKCNNAVMTNLIFTNYIFMFFFANFVTDSMSKSRMVFKGNKTLLLYKIKQFDNVYILLKISIDFNNIYEYNP